MIRFDYKMDRRSRRITWVILLLVIAVACYATYNYFNIGAYYPAWFLSLVGAVGALYILSIPRSLRITAEAFEIHCIVELNSIKLEDLHAVRRLERPTSLFLLLGSYGFFGYYGYYLDWRRWELVKVYASQWNELVEIEDIYEQRYVVSCSEADRLVELLDREIKRRK